MPVTEFAIISLRSGYDELDFLETLMQCQEIQDAWTRAHHPYNLEPNTNLSSMYIERSDPPSLLISAPWDSIEAHGEWIQTSENQACNAKISGFIKPGCEAVLLRHLNPAGKELQLRKAFLEKDSFNVARITAGEGKKEKLQEMYEELESGQAVKEADQRLWAGWRIEELDGREELVVFWTDEVPDEKVRMLMEMGDETERKRFTHVV
ncbi:hypothetical protein QQS21_007228 [Conoideocrella luteorostrata]|uniref:ABM domain-containing protein n=1 Tax=Conoideocrella luteorostrata TaxID=1105319 RepID=A0AAJ0CNI1_9HYPO|nr:hypothetical protein QQS21_007228 [Conoideocrella luteorostrata]